MEPRQDRLDADGGVDRPTLFSLLSFFLCFLMENSAQISSFTQYRNLADEINKAKQKQDVKIFSL